MAAFTYECIARAASLKFQDGILNCLSKSGSCHIVNTIASYLALTYLELFVLCYSSDIDRLQKRAGPIRSNLAPSLKCATLGCLLYLGPRLRCPTCNGEFTCWKLGRFCASCHTHARTYTHTRTHARTHARAHTHARTHRLLHAKSSASRSLSRELTVLVAIRMRLWCQLGLHESCGRDVSGPYCLLALHKAVCRCNMQVCQTTSG